MCVCVWMGNKQKSMAKACNLSPKVQSKLICLISPFAAFVCHGALKSCRCFFVFLQVINVACSSRVVGMFSCASGSNRAWRKKKQEQLMIYPILVLQMQKCTTLKYVGTTKVKSGRSWRNPQQFPFGLLGWKQCCWWFLGYVSRVEAN